MDQAKVTKATNAITAMMASVGENEANEVAICKQLLGIGLTGEELRMAFIRARMRAPAVAELVQT